MEIPYLEHLAGVYNLCMARALSAYALGESLGSEIEKLKALIFASLWHNALLLNPELESFEVSEIESQIPESIDAEFVKDILTHLQQPDSESVEASIIRLCNHFDQTVFDRTYIQTRSREVVSGKEAILLMKLEGKYDKHLLDELELLMISESYSSVSDSCILSEPLALPKDPDRLAEIIEKTLSEEQRRELISKLRGEWKCVNQDARIS